MVIVVMFMNVVSGMVKRVLGMLVIIVLFVMMRMMVSGCIFMVEFIMIGCRM